MDPISTPMLIGAVGGAIMNEDDPLKGAALGGALGYGGSALMGAGSAAAATPAGYGALPGMAAPSAQTAALAAQGAGMGAAAIPAGTQGAQAAMLAQQTGEFGLPGLLATGEAAAAPGSLSSGLYGAGLYGAGSNLAFGGQDASKMMQAGKAIGGMGQQQQQPQTIPQQMASAPMNRPQPLPFRSPYEGQQQNFTYGQPSLLPGYRG